MIVRIAELWTIFLAYDHRTRGSTQTTSDCTGWSVTAKCVATALSVRRQNLSSLVMSAKPQPDLVERIIRPHQHLRLRDRHVILARTR